MTTNCRNKTYDTSTIQLSKDENGRQPVQTPETGDKMIIRSGLAGTPVGCDNLKSEYSFDARHDVTGVMPKKFIKA
jgi:hypothetical protein